MGTKQKKGEKGAAANYLTRTQALKRLQIPLKDFRRLCILKGVFPRSPHRRLRGRDKTYYLSKDIRFLQHEPLLEHVRQFRVWKRRLQKAKARGEQGIASKIATAKPRFRLDNILRERYPTFDDALRDLDDALCSVHLFARLSSQRTIPPNMVASSAQIVSEWQAFIAHTHSLRKMFLSIKGIYYQADVRGVQVTWLEPWIFTTNIPRDIDVTVMMTFLDLHAALLRFVLYRLYTEAGLAYPPAAVATAADAPAPFATVALAKLEAGAESGPGGDDAAAADGEGRRADAVDPTSVLSTSEREAQQARQTDATLCAKLFTKYRIFLNREVPSAIFAFAVRACGGEVGWQGPGSPFDESDPNITHHVIDRPVKERFLAREYVQPQWLADCINARVVLPVREYAPGASLPPHLSPFVDNKAEGYVPTRAAAIEKLQEAAGVAEVVAAERTAAAAAAATSAPAAGGKRKKAPAPAPKVVESSESDDAADSGSDNDNDSEAEEDEAPAAKKVQTKKGAAAAPAAPAPAPMDAEQRKRARMVLSKKKQRLYDKVSHSVKEKEKGIKKLEQRRDAAEGKPKKGGRS